MVYIWLLFLQRISMLSKLYWWDVAEKLWFSIEFRNFIDHCLVSNGKFIHVQSDLHFLFRPSIIQDTQNHFFIGHLLWASTNNYCSFYFLRRPNYWIFLLLRHWSVYVLHLLKVMFMVCNSFYFTIIILIALYITMIICSPKKFIVIADPMIIFSCFAVSEFSMFILFSFFVKKKKCM